MYADVTDPLPAAVMAMSYASWELADITVLRINHELEKTVISHSKPVIIADTVTSSQIEETNFLKHCNVNLKDKYQIINFYDNIFTQAIGYNIFLGTSKEITPTDGDIPDHLFPKCCTSMVTALYSK